MPLPVESEQQIGGVQPASTYADSLKKTAGLSDEKIYVRTFGLAAKAKDNGFTHIIRGQELMTYLRTSVEIGEDIQWSGKGYNILMIVGRRPDRQSLSGGVTAHRYADSKALLEHIKAEVTQELVPIIKEEWRDKLFFFTKVNCPEFKIQLDVPHESQIVHHYTTRVERFSEETDPTRKVIRRIEGAVLNSEPSPRCCEETKRIVKEGTDTLVPYCDDEVGNYRRRLDSMSEHQHATTLTYHELQHFFLQNETLHEEEDHKGQAEKAKSMEPLASDLAKAKQDLPTTD
ncbi:hypothetical protein FVEG_12314 [Fusarium verticillioides 7600]|uniref:Uncharacterized protein n=1 Tax=Gibberella moniliformis (strain M3125 / FGSC 7600) TaxID=334819 RepID=W7NC21_GIBM7|nr:hypothetical protein FVEG_12314 [Fusarium verticillioides 7600]EWG54002.1 hypothetical protein FVEG_12314 [Fusarium verticillioides 7600]